MKLSKILKNIKYTGKHDDREIANIIKKALNDTGIATKSMIDNTNPAHATLKISAKKFAVEGTPTDCVMMAMNQVMADNPPDLLLSGVNRGGNMGEDVTYSGTIAAAMEGTLVGVPSIALSQSFANRKVMHWSTAEQHASDIIRRLVAIGWSRDVLMNINFPDCLPDDVKGVEVTRQGRRDFSALNIEQRIDARERPYYWIGFRPIQGQPEEGTDIRATEEGRIAITPLHLDLTENKALKQLKAAF